MKPTAALLLCLLPLLALAQGLRPQPRPIAGADHLLADTAYLNPLQGQRVGVVANQSSMVGEVHLVDTLLARGIHVCAIFAPEHGFRGQLEAGVKVNDARDARTGLPIHSLYGKNKKPTPAQLKEVDIMLFDLQDVGCRFYTYISTLTYVMEACVEEGIPLVVLDRPNPNGHYVDGPILEPRYQSFVGMHPVPIVYGMTIGEYARMVLGEGWLWMQGGGEAWQKKDSADYARLTQHFSLTIVPLQRYNHQMRCTLPVRPSPNLPNAQAIALYPSLCLLEGTTVSVGRGTPYPFQVVGSGDCQLDLRKVHTAPSLNLDWLLQLRTCTPQGHFFLSNGFFDRLAGTASLRLQIEAGHTNAEIHQSWDADLQRFRLLRQEYLLYPADPLPQP